MHKKGIIITILVVLVLGGVAWFAYDRINNNNVESISLLDYDQSSEAQLNIIDLLALDPNFSTLVDAIETAGLTTELAEAGPITIFAPTNDAFEKLPEGTVDDLIKNPEKLKAVLNYHVVNGNVPASEVINVKELKTLNGKVVAVSVNGDEVKIGPANIIDVDNPATNGTIHIIDTVLVP